MKVFLTGATGYLGAHLTTALLARGHQATLLVRDPKKPSPLFALDGVTLVAGDVLEAASAESAMRGHEALIHNALVWDEAPTELELKDPRASVALALAAQRAGIRRWIYTSSIAVHRPFKPQMSEADALAPSDFYGASKAASELVMAALAQMHGGWLTTIRPGPVVGAPAMAGAPHRSDRRIVAMIEQARRGDEIVVAPGEQRQFIGAADLARVYAAALEASRCTAKNGCETIGAVARDAMSWESIAYAVVQQVGSGCVRVAGASVASGVFEVSRLEQTYGLVFSAQDAMQEHIAHLVATHESG